MVYGYAGLSSEMAGKLTRVVGLNADRLLTCSKNLRDFIRVKRNQILDLKLIRPNTLGGKLYERFVNHSFGRAPSDQGDVGILRALEHGRCCVTQQPVELAHSLLLDLAAHRLRGEDVADQNPFFVVIVTGGYVEGSFGARQRAW